MENIQVMLVCGGGASSGFLAQSMRKYAKKQGLNYDIFAKSETDIDNYIDKIDVLLIGPHLAFIEPEIKEKYNGTKVKIDVIDRTVYGSLDGEKTVKQVQDMLNSAI